MKTFQMVNPVFHWISVFQLVTIGLFGNKKPGKTRVFVRCTTTMAIKQAAAAAAAAVKLLETFI